ncbi:MAG: hypothetical protein ACRDTT_01125, partial [Pseudonocardiaceae bacterium]
MGSPAGQLGANARLRALPEHPRQRAATTLPGLGQRAESSRQAYGCANRLFAGALGVAGLLYVDGGLVGVIEAKREDVSLIGAEQESDRYAAGLTTEIVPAVREIFGGGNEFCTKITYRSDDPE